MAEPDPQMPLPQELIDLILDFVGDSQSLKSCALASSLLRGSSQKRLFTSLTLMPQSKGPEAFIQLVSHAPHIPHHVRVLTIDEHPNPRWITDGAVLFPAILAKFINLERLAIHVGTQNAFQWTESPAAFKDALREAVTSKVTTLRLHRVWFSHSSELAALLARPSSLTSLNLSAIFIDEVDSAGDDAVVPLAHLRLSHLTGNLERCLTQSKFISAHLRHLHISFDDVTQLQHFRTLLETNVQFLGANLEHLHLECTGTRRIAMSPTSQPLTALRTLELTLLLPSKYLAAVTPGINVQYQDWMLHMFRSPSFASPNLQRIVMNIRIPTHNEADMFFISNLHELDERIIALDVVPDVVVRLHSKLDFHGRWRANLRLRVERQVKDTFPFLYQRGMLRIELL
ncbi:hypothetical protein C8F01DRAFT_1254904 [Mycena amicta]|nr:hypothetical protein C8F01DRAFT_1254904 [Mycena amicta]